MLRFPQKILMLVFLSSGLISTHGESPVRERIAFNLEWRFTRDEPTNIGQSLDYERVRDWVRPTGNAFVNYVAAMPRRPPGNLGEHFAYTTPGFNDREWRTVELPHDWGMDGPFDQELIGFTAKLPWFGAAWYRKKFQIPANDAGRCIFFDVDGALSNALVWCNGQFVGGWPYGYASWRLDLTPYIRIGTENVLAVRLNNPRFSSRWYPGSGLYRNVWLVKTQAVHIGQWGVFVTTPTVTDAAATVDVNVTVDNNSSFAREVKIGVQLFRADDQGRAMGEALATGNARTLLVLPASSANVSSTLTLEHPLLWSLEQRQRYIAETSILDGDRVIDRVPTAFGVRTLTFSAQNGFHLNGRHIRLQGVCLHSDLGALGSAFNLRAAERQLEILRDMGCNAIRTSHNPPAPEFLDLCDRLGFLVMDEAFDAWRTAKQPDDYNRIFADWHEQDLRALIRRDRNHPSVIQWSIGNEIREQFEAEGWKLAAHLAGIVREEDRTRAVTGGFNAIAAGYNGFQTAVDIVGYNYKPAEYMRLRQTHPYLVIQGAETASTVSSRGEYFFPVTDDRLGGRENFQVSSYDLSASLSANSPDVDWKALDENPSVLGEFVWTGFDYLGEPTPYNSDSTILLNFSDPAEQARARNELDQLGKIRVPSRSSYFGIVDLAGFPKDRYYLYQSRWRPDLPMAHILPHWNWPERVGEVTPVHVYTSGDEAELFLNGKSLGRKKHGSFEYRLRWNDVVYEPGELKVITYKAGRPWAEQTVRSTGPAAQLALSVDRSVLQADGCDLAFVTVRVADAHGATVPRSHPRITFSLSGPGTIAATDNGNATDLEFFRSPHRNAFNGLALAVVRSKRGELGKIVVRAESPELGSAIIEVESIVGEAGREPKAKE
jgi:beta-galactosidase